jgi:hypothetical protein
LSFFEDLVLKYRDRYHDTAELCNKRDILKEIVAGIPHNGRFLKHTGDHWVVLSAEKVLIKVAQALQYRMRTDRNVDAAAAQTMLPLQNPPQPDPILTPEALGIGDPPDIRAQKTLELYSQWMVRANEVFWQQVAGPEARALFPEDMLAAVPFDARSDTSFPANS